MDLKSNGKVEKLIKKIQVAKEKLEKSSFYAEFKKQMEHPDMVARIKSVIGTDRRYSQLQLVLYGLGGLEGSGGFSFLVTESREHTHMQFALALLLRERFQWVCDIQVYDPAHTAIDRKAINAFNCSYLSIDEKCRRTVDRPTLFFMPRCPFYLFDNLLTANWKTVNLRKIIILGNSFWHIVQDSAFHYSTKIKALVSMDQLILREIPLPETAVKSWLCYGDRVYMKAFDRLSWHFFGVKC